jgi:hypothetical protein
MVVADIIGVYKDVERETSAVLTLNVNEAMKQ